MPECDPIPTRTVAVRLYRIAADHAGGLRERFPRERALAELAESSTDPDLLAEAAAAHAIADNWYAILAVDLLIEAGADRALIQVHAALLGERAREARTDKGRRGPGPAGRGGRGRWPPDASTGTAEAVG